MSNHDARFSAAARGMRFSAIRKMTALIERPGIISFAPGQPSAETFPVAEFRQIVNEIIEREHAQAFQYVLTRGVGALIEAVRRYVEPKGIHASTAETLITDGSQQGLDLVSRVLLDPGDVALVELPSYIGATSAFRGVQGRMVGVRLDERGIDLGDLRRRHAEERAAGRTVKFLYVVSNFQNPSGLTHPLENRRELMKLARELDLLVVEDDPYGDLYFEGTPLPPLKSMDEDGRVIYLSSFSRILAPGLRTAFVIGPEEVLAKIEIAKQSANLCGSSLDQRIILACLERGLIEEQKARIRPYYRNKRDILVQALEAEALPGVRWTTPKGGLFLWVTLPEHLDAEKLLPVAVEQGVAYVAGGPFFVDGSGANTLRLNYSKEDPDRLREGVRRLGRAIRAGHP